MDDLNETLQLRIDPNRNEMPFWYQLKEGRSSKVWCSMITIGTGSQVVLKTVATPQKDRTIEQVETMGTISSTPTWKHVPIFLGVTIALSDKGSCKAKSTSWKRLLSLC